jgi:subtilisin-like proprotein convertase family protein
MVFFLITPFFFPANTSAGSVTIPFSGRIPIFSEFTQYETKPSPPPNGPVYIAAGDIDQDGDMDVVNEWNLYENKGNEGFEFIERTLPEGARNLLLTDLNGDDRLDLVCSGYWYVATGPSAWNFEAHEIDTLHSEQAKTADLDLDGDLDVVFSNSSSASPQLGWLENLGGSLPEFSLHEIDSASGCVTAFEVIDFDKDLDPDILLLCGETGSIDLLRNNREESSSFEREKLIRSEYPFESFGVSDLDSDGDVDIFAVQVWPEYIVYEYNENFDPPDNIPRTVLDRRLVWYENTRAESTPFKIRTINSFDSSAEVKAAPGDINGDGNIDLVSTSSPFVGWFEHNGEIHPQLDPRSLSPAPYHQCRGFLGCGLPFEPSSLRVQTSRSLFPVDFDEDGDVDFLESYYALVHTRNLLFDDGIFHETYHSGVLYENQSGVYTTSAFFEEGEDSEKSESGDGIFEPGEAGRLVVQVESRTGRDLQDVAVVVSSNNPGVSFSTPTMVLADLVSGETRTLTFEYLIGEDTICGSSLEADILIDWTSGHSLSSAESEDIGRRVTFNSTGQVSPGSPIPDNDPAGATSDIVVSAPNADIVAVEVTLDISHTYRGDLLATLTSPSGYTVTLFDGDLDDGAFNLVGTFEAPELAGLPAHGVFTLTVIDRTPSDTGSINGWSLSVDHRDFVCNPDDLFISADFTGDGGLDSLDLFSFQPHWKRKPSPRHFDFNQNGEISPSDLMMFLEEFSGKRGNRATW